MLSKFANATEATSKYAALAAGVLTVGVFCLIMTEVIGRYVVGRPLLWVVDVSEMALIGIFYLPAALIASEGGHIRIDVVINRLHGRVRSVFDLFASLLGVVFAILIVWKGWGTFWNLQERGTITMAAELPVYPATFLIFLGGVFYAVQLFIIIVRNVSQLVETKTVHKGWQ